LPPLNAATIAGSTYDAQPRPHTVAQKANGEPKLAALEIKNVLLIFQ
jgi:hypothetical protein